MKIVLVSTFYSAGMGYTENCLPKALAALGHDVHVLTSNLNIYGNSDEYDKTYKSFLGPADEGSGEFRIDGYTVHRIPSRIVFGYVFTPRLGRKLANLRADVVHSTSIASLQTFQLAAFRRWLGFKLFTESHHHLSVVRPYLKSRGAIFRKWAYYLTRTLPTMVCSLAVHKCYAISPDCLYVANRFYGVPLKKLDLQSLGTDTQLFHAASGTEEHARRKQMRRALGYSDSDIVCVYTGRFSDDKNPLLLAEAVELLCRKDRRFRSLFIGEGKQREAIRACTNATILPFMKHTELAEYYRLADIAVWPRQESMSMLDAAASELPLIVSDKIGERDRVAGSGEVYQDNRLEDLVRALSSLASEDRRRILGSAGRTKMIQRFSWEYIARAIEVDYNSAMQ